MVGSGPTGTGLRGGAKLHSIRTISRTRLATSVLDVIIAPQQALVTRYAILKGLLRIYQDAAGPKLFRKEPLGNVHVQRVISNLIATKGVVPDPDHSASQKPPTLIEIRMLFKCYQIAFR